MGLSESDGESGLRAFRRALEECLPMLHRMARARFPRDQQRADDLVQDTMENALKARGEVIVASMAPWLTTILEHRFFDLCRAEKRSRLTYTDSAPEMEAPVAGRDDEEWWWERVSPDDVVEAAEHLSPRLREVFVARYFERLSDYAAISRRLGIPPGTVASRLSRARDDVKAWITARRKPVGPDETQGGRPAKGSNGSNGKDR